MIDSELKKKCIKLDAKEKEFQKWSKLSKTFVISILIVLVGYLFWLPEGSDVFDYPNEGYSVSIYFIASSITAYFLSQKAKRYRITGYSKNIVKTYRSYSLLDEFLKDGIFSHLDKAEKNMDSVSTNLQTLWSDSNSEFNPPFKSLDTPIKKLMENLDNRIIPALSSDDERKIEVTRDALGFFIEFLISEQFEEIHKINKHFETFPDVSEEVESTIERIKQNRHLLTILYSSLVIGTGFGISQIPSLIKPDFSFENQIMLWAIISVPFTLWIIQSKNKK